MDDTLALGTYLHEWHEWHRALLRPTMHKNYEQLVRCYLVPHLGNVLLAQLDRRASEQTHARLLAAGGLRGKPLAHHSLQSTAVYARMDLEQLRLLAAPWPGGAPQ